MASATYWGNSGAIQTCSHLKSLWQFYLQSLPYLQGLSAF